MLGIRAKRHVGPPKADIVTCSSCFIRCTSGSVLPTALPAVFAICTHITAIAPARPIAQRSPSALPRNSMRCEHCGNFSVAQIVMSAEVLQRGRGLSPPRPEGRRVARFFHAFGGNCSPGHAVVLHARAAQSSEKRCLKSADSVSSHNSADFKVNHYPISSSENGCDTLIPALDISTSSPP